MSRSDSLLNAAHVFALPSLANSLTWRYIILLAKSSGY
jgi:hypothetical protein